MKLRTRLVALVSMLLLVLGVGASQFGPSASASTSVNTSQTDTNGCVVFPSMKVAICIKRL